MADGICVAFGQNAYETSPTWTRIDDPAFGSFSHKGTSPWSGRYTQGWETHRGRAYELDKTETGTATIRVLDPNGFLDPTNRTSPLYGKITPMLRARINVLNPSSLAYWDIFTGFVDSWKWRMDTAEQLAYCDISLNDGFEILARGELTPDANGLTTFVGDSASTACQTRLNAILNLANWPDDSPSPPAVREWRKLNTGNCKLQATVYNAQTSYLAAMQDVADAEFPGVANIFCNKRGAVTFLGKYPRFQPTNYPDDIQFWNASDRPGLAPSGGAALISDIEWDIDSKNLINAALCYPFGIALTSLSSQLATDGGSIAKYGLRSRSFPDLINDGQNAGGSGGFPAQPALNANDATKLFSTYYATQYSTPVMRISKLEFKSRNAGDSATWALMTGVEIGDIITVYTTNPGGGGFSKETMGQGVVSQFFVEGIHNMVTGPLHENVPEWTMNLDVSPRAWFPLNYPIGG